MIEAIITRKLEASEMNIYRYIVKILWTKYVTTSSDVSGSLKKKVHVVKTAKKRKVEYFGHIMRHTLRFELLLLVLQGKVEERSGLNEEFRLSVQY